MVQDGVRPLFDSNARFTYDLSRWPEPVYPRLTQTGSTNVAAFALSSSTEIVRVQRAFDTTSRDTIMDYPYPLTTDTTNLTLIHSGDNTHYAQVYQFYTPIDAIIDRIFFNVGLGFNVSAYSSGNFRMTNCTVRMISYRAQGQVVFDESKDFTFSMTSMTAVDNQIATLNTSWLSPVPIFSDGLLSVYFDIFAATGTGTWQKGIIPIFPYQNTGGIREYGTSGMLMHMRPMPIRDGSVLYPATFAQVEGEAPFSNSNLQTGRGGLNSE